MRTQFTRYGLLVSSSDTKVRSWCLLLILSLSSARVDGTAQAHPARDLMPMTSCPFLQPAPKSCLPPGSSTHRGKDQLITCIMTERLRFSFKDSVLWDVTLAIRWNE